ncbi:MAG: sigma-54 interaction domain-containing protein [Acidobacteriota bacterium]
MSDSPPSSPKSMTEADHLLRLLGSPLRLALVAILRHAPGTRFDLETLSRKTGRLKVDVEQCLEPLIGLDLVDVSFSPKLGGLGYRYRPLVKDLEILLQNCLQQHHGDLERAAEAGVKYFEGMIGRDEKMLVVFEMIHTLAKSDISALILGATGTGKELAAHAIHDLSPRASSQFHAINCASLPESLFEAELFGYEKGAFTSAHRRKIGRLELADGGTLFLDEIGELNLAMQVKLLRVLETRSFERIGGTQTLNTDFRLVCATHRSLEDMVVRGEFREDLFYRINVFPIRLPSLRERVGDIPILAQEFLRKFCRENGLPEDARRLADSAVADLVQYDWPGNIRELENVIQRAAVMAGEEPITSKNLRLVLGRSAGVVAARDEESIKSLREVEREHVTRTLSVLGWNIKATSEVLGISRVTLYKKIKDYGLQRA